MRLTSPAGRAPIDGSALVRTRAMTRQKLGVAFDVVLGQQSERLPLPAGRPRSPTLWRGCRTAPRDSVCPYLRR